MEEYKLQDIWKKNLREFNDVMRLDSIIIRAMQEAIKEAQTEQLILSSVSISLLKKYMIHGEQCKGVNFVSDIDRPWSGVEFTKEEIAYLQELDKEIEESNEC
jgi:hypothetical protein